MLAATNASQKLAFIAPMITMNSPTKPLVAGRPAFAMANAGLPATSGFVGEFMVIMGAMKANFWLAFVAASTLILGAAYTLWMYKRVIFGAVANAHVGALKDLNPREFAVLAALAAAVLFMGVYPLPFTEVMHASVNELLKHVATAKH